MRFADETVEVHLGNHLGDNAHHDKLSRVGGETNPFIDTTTWRRFLEMRKAQAEEYFKEH